MKPATSSLCLALLLASCTSTITPRVVESQSASFDGINQNSGFIQFNADGSGVITPACRDRYNSLVDKFGKRFLPPLKTDSGVTQWIVIGGQDTYRITPEALVNFKLMNLWKHSGQ